MRGLKYISWGDTTGYAVAAKSYVRALIDAKVALTWTPMLPGRGMYEAQDTPTWSCPKLATVCNRALDYDTVLIHTVPEYYPDWIERERAAGRRVFGYTVWELESLPSHWPAILNRLSGVLVPCAWNATVFRRSGVRVPIHVVPHLSQFEEWSTQAPAGTGELQARLGAAALSGDRFIFYTIGYWSHRKAPYLALKAYWQAFTADDPVLMVVKTSTRDITRWHRPWRQGFRLRHPGPGQAAAELAAEHARPVAPYQIVADESWSDAAMLALHERGDCFVSLARTEGWGLGAFEAARLGKPVVTTGYGGQLAYLPPDLAWLVEYDMVPVYEPTWRSSYKPGDRWAAPSVAHAAAVLRSIYADQTAARQRGRQLADRVAADFSRAATVRALMAALA